MSSEYFYDYLSSLILQSPVLAINYILQCVAFALFLASFATFFLKTINFAYAEAVTNNRIAQIICIGCFLYLKAWNTWESWFIYFGYICSAYLGIYVYDCCLNISEAYTKKVRGYYVGQVFLYVWIGVFGLAGIHLLGFQINQLYIITGELVIIYLYNAFKRKHIIYSAPIAYSIIGFILLKYLIDLYFLTPQKYIPLHIIPYIMMAFDAEYREAKKLNKDHNSAINQFLKMSVYFVIYTLLNNSTLHFEHILFGVWFIGAIRSRNN